MLLFAAATFVASAAWSAEPVGTLTVTDEQASCPSSVQLEARVDQLLGAPGQTRARMLAAGIGASVRFVGEGGGHRADIELHGARSGQRTLSDTGADCRELAEAAALTLAILIDPSFVPPTASPPSAASGASAGGASANVTPGPRATEPAPQPSRPPPLPPAFPPPRPPLPPVERRAGSASASLVAGGGVTSRLTRPLMAALAGGAVLDLSSRFGFRALAIWIPPSSVDVPPAKIELELLLGSFELCAHFPRPEPAFRVSICAGFSAGSIKAVGSGYAVDLATRAGFYAIQAGLSGDLPLREPLGLWLDGRAYYPLTRYVLEVTGAGTLEPTKIPAVSATIGLRLRLF